MASHCHRPERGWHLGRYTVPTGLGLLHELQKKFLGWRFSKFDPLTNSIGNTWEHIRTANSPSPPRLTESESRGGPRHLCFPEPSGVIQVVTLFEDLRLGQEDQFGFLSWTDLSSNLDETLFQGDLVEV